LKKDWFRKAGIVFYPVSVAGVLLSLFTIVFCVTVFTAVDRNSHSVSDTLYGFFPYFVSAFTVLFWIASNTSAKQNSDQTLK
jgi:hypothetical protein